MMRWLFGLPEPKGEFERAGRAILVIILFGISGVTIYQTAAVLSGAH